MEQAKQSTTFDVFACKKQQQDKQKLTVQDVPEETFDYDSKLLGIDQDVAPVQQKKVDEEVQLKKEEKDEAQEIEPEATPEAAEAMTAVDSGHSVSETAIQRKKEESDDTITEVDVTDQAPVQKKEEEEVQLKAKTESSSKGDLPDSVQQKMEGSFGADFSNVNIHKDSASATNMGALAYTQGNDVHFAPGQYDPESQKGQELLGHELTHVVQQRQGRVKGAQNKGGISINDDAGLEHEADVMGRKAANFQPAHVNGSSASNHIQAKGPGDWLKEINPFAQEEIDPEKQQHLQQEFEVYCQHKEKLIQEEHSAVQGDKKSSKEEQQEDFSKHKEKFLNRMENNKRTFWGTERYHRLMEKWFPDYDQVIQNKISEVKHGVDLKIKETNQTIEKLISRIKEAIAVGDGDILKAKYLLNDASCHADEALNKKEAAEKVLDEYGKDKKETILPQYEVVIGQYKILVGQLQQNIAGIQQDKTTFNNVITTLNTQQTKLNDFNNKISGVKDVQQVIALAEGEFAVLSVEVTQSIQEAKEAGRKTIGIEEAEVTGTFDKGAEDLKTADAKVADIKQKEIARREEERRRKEEEERKRREAEEKRLAQIKANRDKKGGNVFGYDEDIVNTRGGKDYTKEKWSASNFKTEATAKINDSKYGKTEAAFFEHYKNTAEAYLSEWYSTQKGVKKKLSAEMFVNAAKRVYQKYGHLSYVVPVELALIQGRLESGLGTQGASNYTNPFNVGETDKGAKSWVKDMKTPEMGIYAYMDLMANDYLSDKTADKLLETQGESFVNENGARYASAPRYEMEIKAMMGQVMLVADGKRTKVSVGQGRGKNNSTEDATFVRDMLKSLGYTNKDLGKAIEGFQKIEMFPPLTAKQKEGVKIMNKGDKASFDKKEAKGVDGWCGSKGNTLGYIYYLYKKSSGKSSKEKTLTKEQKEQAWNKTKDQLWQAYSDYQNDKLDMIAFGKKLAPHAQTHAHDIGLILDKMGTTDTDNLAYVILNHTSDADLKAVDMKLLSKLVGALNTFWAGSKAKTLYGQQAQRVLRIVFPELISGGEKEPSKESKKDDKAVKKLPQLSISGSVGDKKADNKAEDVKKVQNMLVSLGYLSSSCGEIAYVTKQDKATKIEKSKLVETIKAIKALQKYGMGITADGNIGAGGATNKFINKRVDLVNKYKSHKIQKKGIEPVLKESEWISQFRNGLNFKLANKSSFFISDGDYDKKVEKKIKDKGVDGREVKLKGKDKSITIVKVPGGYRKATKIREFSGISNPLKESQKAYTGKGNYVCCWDTAQAMVKQKGGDIMHTTADRIPALAQYYSSTLQTLGEQTELGVKYIDSELLAGRPVFVGTDKGKWQKYNADDTTEHYIVIVGKIIKENTVYYKYYDPGTQWKKNGVSENNLIKLNQDYSLTSKSQNIAQVRQNTK